MPEPKTWEYILPCDLSADEVAYRADKLARKIGERETLKVAFDTVRQEHKAELSELEAEVRMLARDVSTKVEHRPIRVAETLLFEESLACVARSDTGELVRTRPLRPEERQVSLLPGSGEGQAGSDAE